MRRLVFPVILASGLVMLGAVPASAEPAPTATAKVAAGKKVCKITDPALPELSGIVATENGFVVINDSSDVASERKIFFLDDACKITDRVDFPVRPRDPEDLVLTPDGKTLWIADIGDNSVRDDAVEDRDTIALWSMPADGSKKPKLYRLTYPDGDKHDAEALLLNGDGTPIIVTKEVTKPAGIYVPTAALKTGETGVPLKRVGEIELPRTDTPGSAFARLAQGIVTGGAVAPDGSKVVLRTYLDAFEWDVTNGDVVAALKGKPRGTGLPTDPRGEAITYSTDGKLFYTVSDMGDLQDEDTANYILKYTPATKVVEANAAGTAGDSTAGSSASWFADLSLTDITYLVGGVGVLGAMLVGAGIFGIMRARKKAPPEPPVKSADPTGPEPLDAETELLTVGGPRQGVYGGNRPVAGAASGPGVYGAKPAAAAPPAPAAAAPASAPAKGGVYGGAGRPPQGGAQPPVRPGQGGQPAGRPPQGQPPVRPGQGGQPAGQPGQGGPPAGRPGQPAGRPGQGGQPAGRPAQGGQPAARPGQGGGQPAGRPGGRPAGGQPGRPGGAQPPVRPGQGGQPAGRPPQGQPPVRPGQGGQPAGRPPQGGQPAGRPPQGGQPGARPGQGGGQPGGRPGGGQPGGGQPGGGQPGGRPGQGGAKPGSGVYGAPPPPATGGRPAGGSQRPSGFVGPAQGGAQQPGQQDGRQSMNNFANLNGSVRGREGRFDNPGYGRTPHGR